MNVAYRLATGGKAHPEEVKNAVHQFMDLLKIALVTYLLGSEFAHLIMVSPLAVLGSLLSPVDEVAALIVDHPLRHITKYLVGKSHGLLLSSFYGA